MEKEKRSNKGLIIAIVIILLLAIAGGIFYFVKITSPKYIFTAKINSLLVESESKSNKEFEKFNTSLTLSGNIETTNSEYKQIANIVNDGKIKIDIQADLEAKKALLGANVDYKNLELLQANAFFQAGDQNVYFYVKDLFDKYFKVDMSDSTDEFDIDAIFDVDTNNSENINKKISDKIIKDTISENLKDEYFSKETTDGVTKNTMKLTVGELKALAKNIITELKDNQEFIACFEKQDEVKQGLEDALKEFDDFKNTYDSNPFEVSIYTKGPKYDIEKVDAKIELPESKTLSMTLAEIEKEKYELNADVPDFGKVKLNIEVKEEAATEIENVNTADSVDVNNMTQADQMKLLGNLMNMKLYKYIAPLMQSGF